MELQPQGMGPSPNTFEFQGPHNLLQCHICPYSRGLIQRHTFSDSIGVLVTGWEAQGSDAHLSQAKDPSASAKAAASIKKRKT